jgi:hypothetical protein
MANVQTSGIIVRFGSAKSLTKVWHRTVNRYILSRYSNAKQYIPMENITKYEDCKVVIADTNDIYVLAERLHSHVFRGQGQDWEINDSNER